MNLDKFKPYVHMNTIVQADLDSGDTAQRVGHFLALCNMAKLPSFDVIDYTKAINALTSAPGVYRRSADPTHWGYNSNNFSRDQWNALQLAFAIHNDTVRLKESMLQLVRRKLFHQNTHTGAPPSTEKTPDFSHPTHFSVHIRGMNDESRSWLLPILDLFFLGDLILRNFTDSANDVDNMLAPQLLFANIVMPTFVSKLAIKIYLRTNFIDKIRAYHSPERNGILPFTELVEYAYNVNGFNVKKKEG